MVLELVKIVASISTPLIVAFIGYKLNSRLKSLEETQWQNRKIVEKRLDLYDKIAPDLNTIYCFGMWVGNWKDISPRELIETKRKTDKCVNIYKYIIGGEFHRKYDYFIHSLFRTYTGTGKDALIKSEISNSSGDRRKHCNYEWKTDYDDLFDEMSVASRKDLEKAYADLMEELQKSVGLSRSAPTALASRTLN